MPQPPVPRNSRIATEQKIRGAVVALRQHCPHGNIALRVLETGDLVAILRVDDQEASELATLLGSDVSR